MIDGGEWLDHSVWSRPNYPTDGFRPLNIPGGGGGGFRRVVACDELAAAEDRDLCVEALGASSYEPT